MIAPSGHWSDFGMDTISLAGPLEAKLCAIREAGFTQVTLSAGDLASHAAGVDEAIRCVKASGLRVTAFQPLRDFEGLDGALRAYKVDVAKALIEMCAALRAPVLITTSSVLPHASTDPGVIAADLRKLAMLAVAIRREGRIRGRLVGTRGHGFQDGARRRRTGRHAEPRPRHRFVPRARREDAPRRPRDGSSPMPSSWCSSPTSW
jgi:sugar phosphate isomerase/epimerase